jgi:hypothetical protein
VSGALLGRAAAHFDGSIILAFGYVSVKKAATVSSYQSGIYTKYPILLGCMKLFCLRSAMHAKVGLLTNILLY